MADSTEFYEYLNTVRRGYSNYTVSNSTDYKENGMKTTEQQRKYVQHNLFTASMQVMNQFDPTSLVHQFTAAEMDDWMAKINQLLNETYYVDFSQYYS